MASNTASFVGNIPDHYDRGLGPVVFVDYAADMAKMAADPKTQEWWAVCMPCQEPLATRKQGEWWADMDEVFHHD